MKEQTIKLLTEYLHILEDFEETYKEKWFSYAREIYGSSVLPISTKLDNQVSALMQKNDNIQTSIVNVNKKKAEIKSWFEENKIDLIQKHNDDSQILSLLSKINIYWFRQPEFDSYHIYLPQDSTPEIDIDQINKDRDRIRILHKLGILDLLHSKYQETTGYPNIEQIARIIIKLGISNSKDIKTIAKPIRSLMNKDGEVDPQTDRIEQILRELYLLE